MVHVAIASKPWVNLGVMPVAVSAPPLVPEYPERESDIELVGEMQESAFQDRQWLIKRDGHFLQVSELLYRVAEQANGRHTLQHIAHAVTDATEWIVTDAHVRQIIETKLIPLGIIAVTGSNKDQSQSPRPPSPLMLNLRTNPARSTPGCSSHRALVALFSV
jgi:hypothetical protein